jgi:hypothetical protein
VMLPDPARPSSTRLAAGNRSQNGNVSSEMPVVVDIAFRYAVVRQQSVEAPKAGQSGVIQGESVIGKRPGIPLLPPNDEIMPRAWKVDFETGTVSPVVGLTVGEKLKLHASRLYDPSSIFLPGVVAAINQARDLPADWPQGAEGFARRYASAYGYSIAVRNFISFAIDAPLHLDPRYFPYSRPGPWPRLKHVFAQTIKTRTDDGRETLNWWRIGSAYGAGFVSNMWYPSRIAGPDDAALRGTTAIGLDTAANVIREFSPDLLRVGRLLFRRRTAGKLEHQK